ncbi:MAG: hypothetical protein WCJ11_04665 [Methylococcaceae bacterium]
MNKFFSKVVAFVREEEGLTMIEYAIGAAVIAGAAIAIFNSMGDSLATKATSAGAIVNSTASVYTPTP